MNYRPHHTAISVRNLDALVNFYETLGYRQGTKVQYFFTQDPDGMWVGLIKGERYKA